jgi:hypothetical protein
MNNQNVLTFQFSTQSYGQVRAIPLLLANDLNSKLERWFQNCKYAHLAISNLPESDFEKSLQLEYIYSLRTIPLRTFSEIKLNMMSEIDLLNYHQLNKIVHEIVEKTHKIYISLKLPKQGETIIFFEKFIGGECNKFHRKNFPTKLEIIKEYLYLDSSLEMLNQINKVRNCLEHRMGIVSQEDCDLGKNYMTIRWRYPKIITQDGDMSPISKIKGMNNAEIVFVDEVKRFRKNERIIFNFYDNSKCIFTVNVCLKKIIDGLYDIFHVDQEKTPTILREFKLV